MVQWLISKTFNYILRRNFHGCTRLGYLTQFCSDEIYSFFDSNFTGSHDLCRLFLEPTFLGYDRLSLEQCSPPLFDTREYFVNCMPKYK